MTVMHFGQSQLLLLHYIDNICTSISRINRINYTTIFGA